MVTDREKQPPAAGQSDRASTTTTNACASGMSAWVALAVCSVALLWRLAGLRGLEVWRDEALTLLDARLGWRALVARLPLVEDTPPLGFILYKIWMTFFPTELGARLLPVLA